MDKIGLLFCVTLVAVLTIKFIKKTAPEYAFIASFCFGIIVVLFVINDINDILDFFLNIQGSESKKWLLSVYKICGICFIGQWGAQMARDAQEEAIAAKVEMCVKILVLTLCIPYIELLFEMINNV